MAAKPNRTILAVLLLACASLAGAAPLVAAASVTSRTFTDVGSVQMDWEPGAVGIFDPTRPDNTCLGLLSADGGAGALVLFYTNGRFAVQGKSGGVVPGASQPDPTNCFGLAAPGNRVGASDAKAGAGGYFHLSPIVDGVAMWDQASVVLLSCPDPLDNTVHDNKDMRCLADMTPVTFDGGKANFAPRLHKSTYLHDVAGIATHSTIKVCVEVKVFDMTAADFVFVKDQDWFTAIVNSDGDAAKASKAVQWSVNPLTWSDLSSTNSCAGPA